MREYSNLCDLVLYNTHSIINECFHFIHFKIYVNNMNCKHEMLSFPVSFSFHSLLALAGKVAQKDEALKRSQKHQGWQTVCESAQQQAISFSRLRT